MKGILLTVGLVMSILATGFTQIIQKGIVKKPFGVYKKGDSLRVYGSKINETNSAEHYLVRSRPNDVFIDKDKIELVNNKPLTYWHQVWFNDRGSYIRKNGWEPGKRNILNESALDYYSQANNNNLIYEDDLLYDYLYQLTFKIHPESLIKKTPSNFGIIIIKSNKKEHFTFNNGYIILTTGLIAETKNEKELIEILATCVSHVVLENNLENLTQQIKAEKRAETWGLITGIASSVAMATSNYKQGTNYHFVDAVDLGVSAYFLSNTIMNSLGAKYSEKQNEKAKKVAENFINQSKFATILSDEEYLSRLSGLVSFEAWQEFHVKNFNLSTQLVNKIHKANLSTEKDYLLISKLNRVLTNSNKSTLASIELIKKAKGIGLVNLIELDKELGILYLRLKDKKNSKEYFDLYKNGLLELEKQGFNISDELEYVNQLLFRNKMMMIK